MSEVGRRRAGVTNGEGGADPRLKDRNHQKTSVRNDGGGWKPRPHGAPIRSLLGMKFGRLEVLELAPGRIGKDKKVGWICKCDCGNLTTVRSNSLVSSLRKTDGATQSCGCLLREAQTEFSSWRQTHNGRVRP